jgi:hypothetical protein
MIARYKRGWNVKMAALIILAALFYVAFTALIVCFGPSIIRQIFAEKQWGLFVLPAGFLLGWGVWTFGMLSVLGPDTTVEIANGEFMLRSGFSVFTTRWRFRLSEIQNAYFSNVGWGLHHIFLEMKDGSLSRVHTLLSQADLRDIVDRLREQIASQG